MPGACAGGGTRAAIVFAIALAVSLGGCAQIRSTQHSLFGAGEEEEAGTPPDSSPAEVYYTGSAGVPLFSEPGKSVIARLGLHQKVFRTSLSRGYAFVRVEGSGERGWVNNALLIWRLPTATGVSTKNGTDVPPKPEPADGSGGSGEADDAAAGAPAEAGAPPAVAPTAAVPPDGATAPGVVAPSPAAAAPPPPPTPAAVVGPGSEGRAAPTGVAPSVFNPY